MKIGSKNHKENCQCFICKRLRKEFIFSENHKKKMSLAKLNKTLVELGHKSNCSCCVCKAKRGETKILREIRFCACGCGFSKEVKVNSKWKWKVGHCSINVIPWNKGLTKETDSRIKSNIITDLGRQKIGDSHRGEKCSFYKDGRCKNFKEYDKKYSFKYKNEYTKKYRHAKGISKEYREPYDGKSYTKEYKKLQRQKRKALNKGGGKFSIKDIQKVYEDNIKKYGTLTCYLCLNKIEFGDDSLEHKIPLSRSGTNEYENLAIAHRNCNSKKHSKTEKEYKDFINKKEVVRKENF